MIQLVQHAFHHHASIVLFAEAIGNSRAGLIITCRDAAQHIVSCVIPATTPSIEGGSWDWGKILG